MSRRARRAALSAALAVAALPSMGSCGLSVVGDVAPTLADGAPPDAGEKAVDGDSDSEAPSDSAPPAEACAPGVVCDVIASTTILDVAVTEDALFWLDSSGSIGAAAKDGSGARTIVSGESAPLAGIEADAQYVYWTAGGKLRRASASDGAGPTSIAEVQGGCLRWMTSTTLLAAAPGSSEVYTIRVSDGARATVVRQSVSPWGVAPFSGDRFFYTNYHPSGGRIRMQDGDPNTENPTLLAQQSGPRCMANDGTWLWWANRDSGTLAKSTVTGQGAQPVVTDQPLINGVALDSTYVYWSFQSGIRRRTK